MLCFASASASHLNPPEIEIFLAGETFNAHQLFSFLGGRKPLIFRLRSLIAINLLKLLLSKPLGAGSFLNVSLVVKGPKVTPGFEVWPQWPAQGTIPALVLAGLVSLSLNNWALLGSCSAPHPVKDGDSPHPSFCCWCIYRKLSFYSWVPHKTLCWANSISLFFKVFYLFFGLNPVSHRHWPCFCAVSLALCWEHWKDTQNNLPTQSFYFPAAVQKWSLKICFFQRQHTFWSPVTKPRFCGMILCLGWFSHGSHPAEQRRVRNQGSQTEWGCL